MRPVPLKESRGNRQWRPRPASGRGSAGRPLILPVVSGRDSGRWRPSRRGPLRRPAAPGRHPPGCRTRPPRAVCAPARPSRARSPPGAEGSRPALPRRQPRPRSKADPTPTSRKPPDGSSAGVGAGRPAKHEGVASTVTITVAVTVSVALGAASSRAVHPTASSTSAARASDITPQVGPRRTPFPLLVATPVNEVQITADDQGQITRRHNGRSPRLGKRHARRLAVLVDVGTVHDVAPTSPPGPVSLRSLDRAGPNSQSRPTESECRSPSRRPGCRMPQHLDGSRSRRLTWPPIHRLMTQGPAGSTSPRSSTHSRVPTTAACGRAATAAVAAALASSLRNRHGRGCPRVVTGRGCEET